MSLAEEFEKVAQSGSQVRILSEALRLDREKLAAANRDLSACETKWNDAASCCAMATNQLAAERKVSDKLEAALRELRDLEVYRQEKGETYGYLTDSPRVYALASAALAEVAAIRANTGEQEGVNIVANVLRNLRAERDKQTDPEIRSAYNSACDRLDVLHSKLVHVRLD
jgi:hypothetical protein